MTEYSATRTLRADAKTVRDILLDASRLPEWNPAVRSVTTTDPEAMVGRKYPTVARLPGRASLTYTRIEPGGVDWRLEAPGAIEVGRWRITSLGNATAVTHTMAHSGPIFVLLRHAMQSVPNLRLDRLQLRAEERYRSWD